MKAAILCCAAFFFATVLALPTEQDEAEFKAMFADPVIDQLPPDLSARITNGVEAAPHSIPYQAYLIVTGSSSRWLCGGSLISPKHVLTAGHCVDGGTSATIYLGAHNLQASESTRITLQSRHLIRHEDYDLATISNDIGIIELNEEVELNEYVNVIALPSHDVTDDYEGANVKLSGWGRVAGDEATSPVLLEVNSTVISNAQCKRVYSIVIDSMLCISGTGGVGSCSGDSGGPLVYDNVQIGVVSYGATGCPAGYPSGFSRITSFLDWIEDNTGLRF